MNNYSNIVFDWGDTLMTDIYGYEGPMFQWPDIRVVDGAQDMLARLSKDCTCHLATNAADSSEREIWLALERGGLAGFIDRVFCQENMGCKKTDNDYYETVAMRLGGDKSQILMIGDSLENDVYRAQQTGIDAVWLNPECAAVPEGVRAISQLSELEAFLTVK